MKNNVIGKLLLSYAYYQVFFGKIIIKLKNLV